MLQSHHQHALAGLSVVEIGGGAAAAYCGRLLADAGAAATAVALAGDWEGDGAIRGRSAGEAAFAAYLSAGKEHRAPMEIGALQQLCRAADVVLVGEDSRVRAADIEARKAVIDLTWFGDTGACRHWKGTDLIVQALTAMPHLAGPVEGPPLYAGDRHSTMIGGVTACIAALAGILAPAAPRVRRFSLSILEANIVLSEMDIHFVERDGVPLKRHGINRFSPNGPVGIYPCKDGWVGITATTPEQWKSLCIALQMHEQAADERLVTRELRFARLDEVEDAMARALAARSSFEWAELGRRYRVPIVVVPDAGGILDHPIFKERESLASFAADGRRLQVPRTPFGLSKTPTATMLDAARSERSSPAVAASEARPERAGHDPPLSGLTVVDFTMGWAGPLASRLLADLGAEVLKIEAGRYPDWWRGVNWTEEYVATRQYENAKGYCALNRGKLGVSLDLTSPSGRELALRLVSKAEAVIENQAAGVMRKLGLGYDDLREANADIVMTSMSAFGTGNAWSDTRAYGSTLEQASGLPSFMGQPGTAPTMAHLAYGDPVGGLYGCAALLTALVHKRRTGEGQYVNVSMVEAMLQFATPALLQHQIDPAAPLRLANRHPLFVPHGIFPCLGGDRWVAVAVDDAKAFAGLARTIGREDWIDRPEFATAETRRECEDQIEAAIVAWSAEQEPEIAAALLQRAGVAAAPVPHTEQIVEDPHLVEADFFIDLVREFSGPQRQAGIAILQNGQRLGARVPAPLMGEHSWQVLQRHAGLTRKAYDKLVAEGVISLAPGGLRSAIATPASEKVPADAKD